MVKFIRSAVAHEAFDSSQTQLNLTAVGYSPLAEDALTGNRPGLDIERSVQK